MIDPKKSGFIVKNKEDKYGRTIHGKGIINGKVPVYFATKMSDEKHGISLPIEFSETAILCDPKTLIKIGFID